MEELIYLLQSIRPLSPGLEAHLRSIIHKYVFPKGEYLLHAGEVGKQILYISQGLIRSYRIIYEKEVSKWFMKERDICISVVSFFRQIPSLESLVALEYTECWGITHAELHETYDLFPEFNIHGRIIEMEYYCLSEERADSVLGLTPEDRYALLMETHPDLVRRVKNSHLATLLNVKDRTFNLIRKAYSEKSKTPRRVFSPPK